MRSFDLAVFEGLELARLADAWHDEHAILLLLDVACIEELAQQVSSSVASLLLLLHHSDLLLEGVVVGELGRHLLLLVVLGFLVRCNLLLGAAPLGACLQQVRRDAFAGYRFGRVSEEKDESTYC